jgi:nucleoside-diphosphate-sugar epimerase
MDKCLVTGGAGFIGSHIVRRLLRDGAGVRVLDNLSTGQRTRLADVARDVEFIEGDLRDAQCCREACQGVQIVFHEAALPSVPRSVEDPATYHECNVTGTFSLLLAARDAGCRRVIYAASSAAYGDQPELPKREDMLPCPMSPYALHKLAGEYYCRVFFECYGLETVSLRYFNVFGPQQDPHSAYAAAIPAFVSAMLQGRPPRVFGDGTQTRDFTHIDNVVEANMLAARTRRLEGQVVNIACGVRISINDIIAQIGDLLGRRIAPEYAPPRPGDVMHSQADITRAGKLLGYRPIVDFATGLRQAIGWYKDNSAR